MHATRSAFLLLALPLALAACNPQPASDDAMMKSSAAGSVMVIDLEADGAMMANDASAASVAAMMEKGESSVMTASSKAAMVVSAAAQTSVAPASQAPTATAGVYTAFDNKIIADGQTKVLFFYAAWCPACRTQDTELVSWYGTRASQYLTTYKVDYDSEKSLKATYGVTYQHTFVKVDGKGQLLSKIQGPTDEQLATLLKR